MTRRNLIATLALAVSSIASLAAAAPTAEKTKPLEVTYYYLPG